MQASKLQLDHYYLEELHFALNERWGIPAIEDPIRLKAEDLDNTVHVGRNPDDELEWYIRLTVRLDDKEAKFPYEFTVRIGGLFKVSSDCEPEMIEPLATVNGPSILFGAVREILATVTARSRFVSVFLPSVRFMPMTTKRPDDERAPEQLPEQAAKSLPPKPRKASSRKK